MKPSLKRALAALFSLVLVVSAALALPLVMNQVMKGSLATQVVFAQEEMPQEEDIIPSPLPFATAAPTQEVAPIAAPINMLPTPPPEEVILPIQHLPGATPMPIAGLPEDSSLTQPLPWRKLLIPMAEEDARMWASKLSELTIAGAPLANDAATPNFYLLPDNGPTLVEYIQPRELSLQKLLQGILANLDGHPQYVPDKQVLDRVMNLPISSILLPSDGQHSLFLATQAQRMPLAVLGALASQGKRTVAYSEYTEQRSLMASEAQNLISANPDTAMDKSTQLVAELMKHDALWQLAVIQMTPYACNQFWDYYLAGHHVKAVDMETGEQYILTTDLISGKVVGFTREEGEPYLVAYQSFLRDSENLEAIYNVSLDRVTKTAETLGNLLTGINFFTSEWQITTSELAVQREPFKVLEWEVKFDRTDEEVQLLDPSSSDSHMVYKVTLNENYEPTAWSASPIIKSSQGHGLRLDEKNFDVMLSALMQAKYQDQPEIASRVDIILGNRDQHYSDILEKVHLIFPGAMLTDPVQLWINDLIFQDNSTATQISLICPFLTPDGKTLSAIALVDEEGRVHITQLAVDRPGSSPTPIPTEDENEAVKAATTLASQLAGADLSDASRWSVSANPYLSGEEKAPAWEVSFRPLDENTSPSDRHLSYTLRLSQDLQLISWFTETDAHSGAYNIMGFMEDAIDTKLGLMFADDDPRKPEIVKRVKSVARNSEQLAEKTQEAFKAIFPESSLYSIDQIKVDTMNFQGNRTMIQIFLETAFSMPDGRLLRVSSLVNEDDSIQITQIFDSAMEDD